MTELIAYLHGRKKWTPEQIPGNQLTQLNYAFAKIDQLDIVEPIPNLDRLDALRALYPNLKVNISLGGWGAEGFSYAVESASNRDVFTTNIVNFVSRHNFDGIDLDWEYPGNDLSGIRATPNDALNFQSFLEELRHKLDQHRSHYLLTSAVGGSPEILEAMGVAGNYAYTSALDYINVMSYDLRGSWTNRTGHQTNLFNYDAPDGDLSAQTAVQNLLDHHVPANKIIIGSAAYSRDWDGLALRDHQAPLNQLAAQKGTHTTPYGEVQTLIAAHPENYFWDDQAAAPYYYDGHRFMSFDDPKSVQAKTQFVLDHQLGGLMFWEQSLDPNADLVTAATAILSK